ncbi:MAG: UvrD-helicase domain-containing protein [Chloroflexi bacterium]|nr:UvrD-helicase domain-containing protein [Chloroflexota bacterium]
MSHILDGLNSAQRQAVTATDGPVLVLAGPGSGKTRVLTRRIAYLIQEMGVPPWRIMAMTFTNKAAREMLNRVTTVLEGNTKGLIIGTFHKICAMILRREASFLPIANDYVIFDTADQRALMKLVLIEDLNLSDKQYTPQMVLGKVSNAKNDLIHPENYPINSYRDEIIQRAYQRYQLRLVANNAVDFDDLLMRAVMLFEQQPTVLQRYQTSYDHMLVDEFQDTNLAQYRLVQQLVERHQNIFCVGDEDQSIYRWRGADYRNVRRLREDFPDLQSILLEQNYRSTQTILDAARAVIDKNPHRTKKALFTDRGDGVKLMLHEAHDEVEEGQFVVETIATLTATDDIDPGECAVMYRTNAQSRAIEEAFVRANLAYRLIGATQFYRRKEIKDVLAYLRVVHNPDDDISMLRIINTPTRGIGKKTLETLQAWANNTQGSLYRVIEAMVDTPEQAPLSGRALNSVRRFGELLRGWQDVKAELPVNDLIQLILDETGFQDSLIDGTDEGNDRWGNVEEFVNVSVDFADVPLAEFLTELALVSEVDDLPEDVNAPSLMTLHAAKGLEFDVVFLVGLEEGILPHINSIDDPEQMAEERRLFYVGMTRARERLYLLYAFERFRYGSRDQFGVSRFLADVPSELLVGNRPLGGARQRREAAVTAWPSGGGRNGPDLPFDLPNNGARQRVFHSGERVVHAKYGEGIVIESKLRTSDEEVSVMFDDFGMKHLLASLAKLRKLDG